MKKLFSFVFVLVTAIAVVHASETINGAKKDFQSFKTEMSAKLDSTEKDFELLRAKAAAKGEVVKADTVAEYERTRARLKKELAEMKESSGNSWARAKEGFAKSVDNLNTQVQKAIRD